MAKRNVWRRVLAVLLAVVLMGGMFVGVGVGAVTRVGDDGTTNWDFIVPVTHQTTVPAGYTAIRTASDLNNVRNNLSGKYILMNDIDLSGWGNWVPVGASSAIFFDGTFDGNGFTVNNMMIDVQSNFAGLFGYIKNSTIKNLGIINSHVACAEPIRGTEAYNYVYAGGLAGYSNSSYIENCYNTGSVSGINNTRPAMVGGLLGLLQGDSNSSYYIKNSFNTGMVNAFSESVQSYAGGVAGYATTVSIDNCLNGGNIFAETNSINAAASGGIVGNTYHVNIKACYNIASVIAQSAGDAWTGGIVGSLADYSSVSESANTGEIKASTSSRWETSDDQACSGGIAGSIRYTGNIINDCYNAGVVGASVTAENGNVDIMAGGISGYIGYSNQISNCYNIGSIYLTPQNFTRGSCGNILGMYVGNNHTRAENCYYAKDNLPSVGSIIYDDMGLKNVRFLTDSQMRQQSSFTGFDFINIWKMPTNGGYPELRGLDFSFEIPATPLTTSDIYPFKNSHDSFFGHNAGKHGEHQYFMTDSDFSKLANYTRQIYGQCSAKSYRRNADPASERMERLMLWHVGDDHSQQAR